MPSASRRAWFFLRRVRSYRNASGRLLKPRKRARPAAFGRAGEFDVAEPGEELADRHPSFHAGERHPGAGMHPGAEGEVPVGRPRDVEPVGVGELRRVAVGAADRHVDVSPGRELRAAQRRVHLKPPVADLVRAFEAQEFLHRRADQPGVLAQPSHLIREADQRLDPVADQVGRRLVARVQEEDAVVQQLQLAQRLAVLVGADQLRQHLRVVVARIPNPPRDQRPQIVLELLHRIRAVLHLVEGGAGLQTA